MKNSKVTAQRKGRALRDTSTLTGTRFMLICIHCVYTRALAVREIDVCLALNWWFALL
jgi:hypothetical protein